MAASLNGCPEAAATSFQWPRSLALASSVMTSVVPGRSPPITTRTGKVSPKAARTALITGQNP